MGLRPLLEAGELLITAERSAGVESAGTSIDLHRLTLGRDGVPDRHLAAMRLTRTVGLRVGVYQGRSTLDAAGERAEVPALRRLEIAAPSALVQRPLPLRYRAEDRWDRRFLGDAVALDRQLASLLTGYGAAMGAGATSLRYLRTVLPGLVDEKRLSGLVEPLRPAGESLVGATIATLGTRNRFEPRWRSLFDFRDEGATWGLVALDQAVSSGRIIAALQAALNGTSFTFRTRVDPAGTLVSATPEVAGTGRSTGDRDDARRSEPGGGGTGDGADPGPPASGGPPATPPGGVVSPTTSTPAATVPGVVTIPKVTVPVVTLPPVTVPPITVPPITVPIITVPIITVPIVTVPVSVPPITVADHVG